MTNDHGRGAVAQRKREENHECTQANKWWGSKEREKREIVKMVELVDNLGQFEIVS